MHQTFVTGGSGFVGRALIRRLLERGVPVRALARSVTAADVIRQLGAEPIMGGLDDVAVMRDGMAGCDVVYHSAARVTPGGGRDDYFHDNVEGTQNVLAAASAVDSVKRFVHVGTEAVLAGDDRPIRNADESWSYPLDPAGLYPWSKGLAEQAVIAANGPKLQTVSVRPRMIWGQGDTTLLPLFIDMATTGKLRWVDGGRYLTSTCHVENVVEGLLLAAEKGAPGQIYFVTDGEPRPFRDFVSAMLETQGIKAPRGSVPRFVIKAVVRASEIAWALLPGEPPLGDTAYALALQEVTVSDAKARAELGYQGRVSVEQGLAEMRDSA